MSFPIFCSEEVLLMNTLPYQEKIQDIGSSHMLVRDMLWRALPDGGKVLDVGVADGILARLCSGGTYHFWGVEPNPEWAALARRWYDAIFVGTLSQTPDAFLAESDAVVCADVLEHMVDAERQLQRLVSLQKKETVFLISVPNVAHLWVRLNLLLGRFEYQSRGILDRTHVHFYTRRSFLSLLSHAGLKVEWWSPTSVPLGLVSPWFRTSRPGRCISWLLWQLTRLLPNLLGYQFVVCARRSEKML